MRLTLAFGLLLCLLPAPARGDSLLPPLSPSQAEQARKTLDGFKTNPRGPYLQIRWFCNDGTVHPPSPPPCASHGGGRQHAQLSPAAEHLAAWNLDVGTIIAALDFDGFLDARRDHFRLRELVLENFLIDVDDGWIDRRAQYYRGSRQAEDEERVGRKLLVQLLSDPAWTSRNYLLAGEAAAVVPHGTADSTVRRIRALAQSAAEKDLRFNPIRIKIHNRPGPEDFGAVERFLVERNPEGPAKELLTELAGLLRAQQTRQLGDLIPDIQKRLAGSPLLPGLAALAAALRGGNPEAAFSAGAALSLDIRRQVTTGADGRRNLELLDLNALLQDRAFQTASRFPATTRRGHLRLLLDSLRYATGAGLLSMRQLEALEAEVQSLEKTPAPDAQAYYQSVRYLARSTEWCRATAAKDFGPVARHYQDAEPKAAGLVDQILRSSVALPLAARLDPLVADANRAVGIRHSILGENSDRGVVGLNQGVAVGRLGIVHPGEEETAVIDPDRIYVIPETLADLKPMTGILSLDSGNALSHAQLLAASIGVPNAAIPSSLLPTLEKYRDKEILFAVSPRGVVLLQDFNALSPEDRKLWRPQPAASRGRVTLDAGRLNLADRRVLPLEELSVVDSGVRVGPKAANLAQLARFFPDRVAPALVIPFGIYYEHVDRSLDGGAPLQQQVVNASAEAERLRQSGANPAAVSKYIYPQLTRLRRTIETMAFLPAFEKELLDRMRARFGPDGSYGVFVRSDTNAEDLPEFTGAGLNLTVANQVGRQNILQAIKDVWASPFTERAYDWRSRVLRPGDPVYPSVVLLRTVPSDKSGVIGTVNLETGDTNDITVNVSEGISAVVDGGVAESLLLKPNGEVRLLAQARGTYRKVALPGGGLENRATSGSDFVLTPDEIRQVREMVAEVKARYPVAKSSTGEALPWDIEFGFEKGQLRLFQIRPLVRYQQMETLDVLRSLESGSTPRGTVPLDQPPGS
jgi:hypothetical protein